MTAFQPGWPCVPALSDPPSVTDRLSDPTADDLLPQILALTPRGPAWGTDEAGDGTGASPLMRLVWKAIAGWSAASYSVDFTLALQALPSEITWSLDDWEAEYGLPDPCVGELPDEETRIAAVRAKYAAVGGQSPNYYICLAQSLGIDVCAIEEFTSARIGAKCGTQMWGPAWNFAWAAHAGYVTVTPARVGISHVGDRLATWGNPLLECTFKRAKPAHTVLLFRYDDCVGDVLTTDDGVTPITGDDSSTFLTPG